MPAATPADRLAHELVYPDQDTRARRAVTAADLQRLLDPNYEPFAKTPRSPRCPLTAQTPTTPALLSSCLNRAPSSGESRPGPRFRQN